MSAYLRSLSSASLIALLGLGALAAAPNRAEAQIGVGISVGFAPPLLPLYSQPPIPAYGYLWTPGYWAWDRGFSDYYWVSGLWVRPPRIGFLWTPGYWGWENGSYLFNDGYWGPTVGFYGGVNYGFGYGGNGYGGGEWRGGRLYYNTSVNAMGHVRTANVYTRPVAGGAGRVSFNGGTGGIQARPSAAQAALVHQPHVGATAVQSRHVKVAAAVPALRSKVNHGAPVVGSATRTHTATTHTATTHTATTHTATTHATRAHVATTHRASIAAARSGTQRTRASATTRRGSAPAAARAASEHRSAASFGREMGGPSRQESRPQGGQPSGMRQGGGQPQQRGPGAQGGGGGQRPQGAEQRPPERPKS